jgi:DNA repair protein RadA/Sms
MSKAKSVFVCRECGAEHSRWEGKCGTCGAWNCLEEQAVAAVSSKGGGGAAARATEQLAGAARAKPRRNDGEGSGSTGPPSGGRHWAGAVGGNAPLPLNQIDVAGDSRMTTGIAELDRILGGGLVAGSATLIGGEPGIGKSTLMLQMAARLADTSEGPVLYVSGEESPAQLRLRAARLGAVSPKILVLAETQIERIGARLAETLPCALILDSIQTAWTPEASGAPGSPTQVRESAAHMVTLAKALGVPVLLVGHVTKAGLVAGPRVLEHMVDTVLYFEGDRQHQLRVLRSVKNRFGSTNEVGIFEMGQEGLQEVANPSALFLEQRSSGASGSVITAVLEGSRALLVEVQALAASNGGFGAPRRVAAGIDSRRLLLMIAVLEKRIGLRLIDQDIYVNVPGGVTVEDPAVDLAVLCAIASSVRNEPLAADLVVMGEVGLTGEVRGVSQVGRRLGEASRMGCLRALMAPPRGGTEPNRRGQPRSQAHGEIPAGVTVLGSTTVGQALRQVGL